MNVFLDQNGLVSDLNEMPVSLARAYEKLIIDAGQLPHFPGKFSTWCVYVQMIMIGHEAADSVEALRDVLHGIEEVQLALVTLETTLFSLPREIPS